MSKKVILGIAVVIVLIGAYYYNLQYEEWKAKPENREPHKLYGNVSLYQNGTKTIAPNVNIAVIDDKGKVISETKTDAKGIYRFSVPACFLKETQYETVSSSSTDNPVVVGVSQARAVSEVWSCGESLVYVKAEKNNYTPQTVKVIAGRAKTVKDIVLSPQPARPAKPDKSDPSPVVMIIAPTPIPQPTMKEIPEISINVPDRAAKGDKFTLEFQINPKSEKIVTLGIDIVFDGNLIKAEKVNIIDVDPIEEVAMAGEIGSDSISNIAIAKRAGVPAKFMTIEFETVRSGKANIEATITAVNEIYATAENLKVAKIIEIQG